MRACRCRCRITVPTSSWRTPWRATRSFCISSAWRPTRFWCRVTTSTWSGTPISCTRSPITATLHAFSVECLTTTTRWTTEHRAPSWASRTPRRANSGKKHTRSDPILCFRHLFFFISPYKVISVVPSYQLVAAVAVHLLSFVTRSSGHTSMFLH